jgi:hypothetical protein
MATHERRPYYRRPTAAQRQLVASMTADERAVYARRGAQNRAAHLTSPDPQIAGDAIAYAADWLRAHRSLREAEQRRAREQALLAKVTPNDDEELEDEDDDEEPDDEEPDDEEPDDEGDEDEETDDPAEDDDEDPEADKGGDHLDELQEDDNDVKRSTKKKAAEQGAADRINATYNEHAANVQRRRTP